MVMPVGAASFADALAMVAEIYRAAGAWMSERGRVAGVADEGGWWPQFDTNEEALQALVAAIERAGFAPGRDAVISLDIAASELITRDGRYRLALDGRELDRDALGALWRDWLDRYPIASIEDPFGRGRRRRLARVRARRRRPRADRRRRLPHDERSAHSQGRARREAATPRC